ncbi:hypothetical protein J5X92_02875 [Alteromonas sp. K632G]|uniref:Uncharacterized protein n=2 Tax=Alteromonas naphthalenivorans TaxID=715451 RepID=F5Z6Q4_ALTNA|nr:MULTISPECIES: hypothetical protein [Alteromonas]AEF05567.1 hypothetical protein ambt_20380 [Alteromonas naphthalenivorans]MBO7921157.1 hypothetical protein [Alteromonas sp. K632G]MCQ8848760.1 hypothetical protein [Alteromonas stellipolaris]
MNLLLLLLTMSFLVPENGAGNVLSKEISQVSNDISIQYLASSNLDQASDKDELDDGAYFLSAFFASSKVPNTRFFTYTLLSDADYAAHPIRAPPHFS